MMMRYTLRVLFFATLSVLFTIGCSDDENPTIVSDDTTQEEEQNQEEEKILDRIIGAWTYTIAAMPTLGLVNSIMISLTIEESEDYVLEVLESGEKTLFYQQGLWDTTEAAGTVTFTGQQCQILDTLPDPDTLSTLADTICSRPFTLQRPQNDSWEIQLSNMGTALDALGLTPEQKMLISVVNIALIKQD